MSTDGPGGELKILRGHVPLCFLLLVPLLNEKTSNQTVTVQTRDRPVTFCWKRYRYFQFFYRYLASFRYLIGHQYRYSKICLPIYNLTKQKVQSKIRTFVAKSTDRYWQDMKNFDEQILIKFGDF